eukprot:1822572-Prymnesium_polylepis.1
MARGEGRRRAQKSLSYHMPGPGLMVTRSPVSSVHVSPSSADFQTAVPYCCRPTALRSTPLRTSVPPAG